MKVIIPLAGEGKRLRPHTFSKPKPLLPVAGKPMIDHIMDKLLTLKPTACHFITGHLRHRIESHLMERYGKVTELHFVEQKTLNGTAGAIDLARDAFDEDIIIDFADTLFDADLSITKDCEYDGVFWAMEVEDYQRFGVIVTDADGCMTKIVEKPKDPVSKLANIGLYYIKNTKLLAEGIQHVLSHPVPGKELYLTEAFQYMVEHGARIKVLPCTGWYDCGTAADVLATNKTLLTLRHVTQQNIPGCTIHNPVFIHPTAKIENSIIGPYVSVGEDAHIIDSTIENSIVDKASVIHNAKLKDSIVGSEAHVSGNASKVNIGDHCWVE